MQLILAGMGAMFLFAPNTFTWFCNLFASAFKMPAALVVKSDTSMMLVRTGDSTSSTTALAVPPRLPDGSGLKHNYYSLYYCM